MEQLTWIFLGVVAMGITGVTLFSSVEDILGAALGTLAWGFWALGATALEYRSQTGELVAGTGQDGIAFVGAAIAAIHLLMMIVGTGRMLDVRNAGFDPQERG